MIFRYTKYIRDFFSIICLQYLNCNKNIFQHLNTKSESRKMPHPVNVVDNDRSSNDTILNQKSSKR